jgi:hypothetical protein
MSTSGTPQRFRVTWRAPSALLLGRGWLSIDPDQLELELSRVLLPGWLAEHPQRAGPIVHAASVVPVVVTRVLPPPPLGANRHLVIGQGERVVLANPGRRYPLIRSTLLANGFQVDEHSEWASIGAGMTRWKTRDETWKDKREWKGPFIG